MLVINMYSSNLQTLTKAVFFFLFHFYFREEKEELAKIKTKLFDEKQSMEKHVAMAPVAASIKQRLLNIDDSDVIQS